MNGAQITNEDRIRNHFSRDVQNGCSYCGIKEKPSLVQCLTCEKHFCNNKINKHVQSDIILHLSKTGHTKISPNRNEWRNGMPVACFTCKEKNIYKLFHFHYKKEDYIYCSVCAEEDDILFSPDLNPIVREKRLPFWLAEPSSEEALKEAIELSHKQISFIESSWSKNRKPLSSEIINLGRSTQQIKMEKIKTEFRDKSEYFDNFLPILKIEEECDRKTKGSWFQENVEIEWEKDKKTASVYAYLYSPEDSYFSIRLSPGERLRLRWKDGVQIEGVVKYAKEHEIKLLLEDEKPKNPGRKVTVEYIWTNISFERMRVGLEEFYERGLYSKDLNRWILTPPNREFIPNLRNHNDNNRFGLNEHQIMAVEKALGSDPIVLIQGPPGTGKTKTLTAILVELVYKLSHKKNKILVCAPSNIAVDHVAQRLKEFSKKIKVLRMYSRSREFLGEVNSELEDISLHEEICHLKGEEYKKLKGYIKRKKNGEWLTPKEEKKFKELRRKAEMKILEKFDIVCCTCITAADRRLIDLYKEGYNFEYVVIDEAAQALEPETLLPLLYHAEKVILAGDHKQLGPLVKSKQGIAANFGQSLFERLASRIQPIMLLKQYRMHPTIANFPSAQFYNNMLITDDSCLRTGHSSFKWPQKGHPNFFYHVEGKEEVPSLRESYFNRKEGDVIKKLIQRLGNSGVKARSIAVLTPYHGQKVYLQDLQDRKAIAREVEIESVDGFQGREKDYIIISCVRSNQELGLGFLNDERRLNVAITRAKNGLIICGNAKVLEKDKLWKKMIIHYKANNSFIEDSHFV